MIFEVLNESLNNFRVLGLKGRELPWVTNSTKIYRKSINTDDELTTVLEEAVGRVLAWGSCLCGFIAENVQGGENLDIEREYLE